MIIFLLFFSFSCADAQIEKQNLKRIKNNNETTCITNDVFPIVFDDMDNNEYKTYYENIMEKTPFVCNLGEDEFCDSWWKKNRNWTTKTAIEMNINELITDERWHYLPLISKSSRVEKILDVPEKLELPFSLKISMGQVTLHLCSETELHAVNNKCLRIYITSTLIHLGECLGDGTECIRTRRVSHYLNLTKWNGLILRKSDRIRISNVIRKDNNDTLENMLYDYATQELNMFKLKYMFSSILGGGFLKIHNYKFLSTTEPGFYEMGKPFLIIPRNLCFILFANMCKNCKMELKMAGKTIANFSFADEHKWRRIQVNINTHQLFQFDNQMYVKTIGNEFWKQNNFWALDLISGCGDQTISSPKNRECEYVLPTSNYATLKFSPDLYQAEVENRLVNYKEFLINIVSITDKEIQLSWISLNDQYGVPSTFEAFLQCGTFLWNMANNVTGKWDICRFAVKYSCVQIPLMGEHCRLTGQVYNVEFDYKFEAIPSEHFDANLLLNVLHSTSANTIEVEVTHPSYISGFKGFEITYTRNKYRQKHLNMFGSTFLFDNKTWSSLRQYKLKMDITGYEPCEEYFVHVRAITSIGPGYATIMSNDSPPSLPNYLKIVLVTAFPKTAIFTITAPDSYCRTRDNIKFYSFLYVVLSHNLTTHNAGQRVYSNRYLGKYFTNNSEIVYGFDLLSFKNNVTLQFILGDGKKVQAHDLPILENKPLQENVPYQVTFVAVNTQGRLLKHYFYNFSLDSNRRGNESDGECGTFLWILLASNVISLIGISFCLMKSFKYRQVLTRFKLKNSSEEEISVKERYVSKKAEKENLLPLEVMHDTPSYQSFIPNHFCDVDSKPIRVTEFEKYCKRALSSNEFEKQFNGLPKDPVKPCEVGLLPCNKPKNRFNNIIPYDESRVKLGGSETNDETSYINASYIAGYPRGIAYIATQGPKSLTINDFWQMVWENNVKNIVMLVNLEENGQRKVEKYWPDQREDFQFGQCHVFYDSEELQADYEVHVLRLVRDGIERKVRHFHFLRWPDQGAPLHFQILIPFVRRILEISSKTPMVVHCCSGTAATGVFIMCHICLKKASGTGTLDLLKVAHELRQQRMKMIDNLLQYKLAHLVVMECLIGLQTVVSRSDDLDKFFVALTDPDELRLQMRYLNATDWQNRVLSSQNMNAETFVVVAKKNKVDDICPDASSAIHLTKYPPSDATSGYINAVKVDGYRYPERYLVTQQPLPNTLNDFWRMIVLRNVEAMISLHEINLTDKKSCFFWPTEENPEISPVDFIILKHYSTFKYEDIEKTTVHVFVEGKEKTMLKVTILSLNGWKSHEPRPTDISSLLKLHGLAEKEFRCSPEIVVTCYDGNLACGVYLVTSFITEKIKLEKSFDICEAVKIIRRNRKQFIVDEKQLGLLYEIAVTYFKGFEGYANFAQEQIANFNIYDYID